jgi:uncharacterized membrane protein
MSYFVTVDGVEISSNLTKNKAVSIGKKNTNKGNVGIGKIKYIEGKKHYKLLPLHSYID